MILTGWATCQSVVPWIQEDAEQREVRLVHYKPVSHPNIQNKAEDKKKRGGNTHCDEEWHRQWGRDRSNTMKERRSNSQERVTGWSSRGKAERNTEEREQHTETQRVGKQKRQHEPKKWSSLETLQLGRHQHLSSTHCISRQASSHVGQSLTVRRSISLWSSSTFRHLSHSILLMWLLSSKAPPPQKKSRNVLLHRRPKSKTFYFWTWIRKGPGWCLYWTLKGEHTGHWWRQNKESRLFILLVHENNTSREKRKKRH